jgi:hypothetical protein
VNDDDGRVPPIPMPGLLVGDTGDRTEILIHPGHPPDLYLSSVGCLNLTHPLMASQKMDYLESRARVIAIIDSLRAFAPAAFQKDQPTSIGAYVVIDGEPSNLLLDEGEIVADRQTSKTGDT